MSEQTAAGEKIAEHFRVHNAPYQSTRPLSKARLGITHLSRYYETGEPAVVLPADDAFLVVLYLIDVRHQDISSNRPAGPIKLYPRGSICLVSLQEGAAIAIRGDFEALAFHVPRAHLADVACKADRSHVDDLVVCRGVDDTTVRDIGAALMPLFQWDAASREKLLSHMGLAFLAHIAHRYGLSYERH